MAMIWGNGPGRHKTMKIKAKFVDLAGTKFSRTFKGDSITNVQSQLGQFIEDRKDVILLGYVEA